MSKTYELSYTAEHIDELLVKVDEGTIYQDASNQQHGLMSATDKAKLDALPTGQQIEDSLSDKVDKEAGKGLSKNDYTDDDKAKVASALQTETDPTVPSWAKAQTKPTYTASEVGAIPSADKGVNGGVATLDNAGKIPQAQLPSYVDDVLEYANLASFPATGESGKIYVALDTNKTYRWSGSAYVEIAQGLALGETSSTAFAGNRGKAIEDKIPSSASSSNKLATASDVNGKLSAPATSGTSGQVLTSDGQGGQSWQTPTSGVSSYNDLPNKPQINSVTLSGNKSAADLGLATAAQGVLAASAYQKPQTGIPSTDLASGVQTSLGKADTAVQQITVGTTTTGNAGTNASVTNSGTATAPVLNFTIPRGATGATGPQGPQGPAGPQGEQGNSGYTGAAGELQVVNNLDDGGATSALSAEMGKTLHTEDGLILADSLAEKYMAIVPTIQSGGYYKSTGDFVSNNYSYYTPNFELIPQWATTAYYFGVSYGTISGGILWYDRNKSLLSYFNVGTSDAAMGQAVTIPSGAYFYKASSYQQSLYISFGENNVYDGDINELLNTKKIGSTLKSLLSGNFTENDVNVSVPTGRGGTTAAAASFCWAQQLYNDWPIAVSSVSFYTTTTATSFYIHIFDKIDEPSGTMRYRKSYLINENTVSGDNTINVSSYGIVIPENGAISIDNAYYYETTLYDGKQRMLRTANKQWFAPYATKEYTRVSGTLNLQIVGVEKRYDISVPATALKSATNGNILFGKQYTAIGDSFTAPIGDGTITEEGPYQGYSQVYPYIIGNRNLMSVSNLGAAGTTMNWFISNAKYNNIQNQADYVTIWYGINDNAANIQIGSSTDMPALPTDTTTTCGAFNWLMNWLFTNRPLTKIGVIITDYCEQERREAIISVCQRWGVAYLDLYDPKVPMIRTRGNQINVCSDAITARTSVFGLTGSPTHPNNVCHEWQSSIIEHFMRGL